MDSTKETINSTNEIINSSSNQDEEILLDEFILPEELVKLTMIIAEKLEISLVNELSILENLERGLKEIIEENLDEKEITILIINIIRLTEKFNDATKTEFLSAKIKELCDTLEININDGEIYAFQKLNFQITDDPEVVKMIHQLIDLHLNVQDKSDILDLALQILRIFYCSKVRIYQK